MPEYPNAPYPIQRPGARMRPEYAMTVQPVQVFVSIGDAASGDVDQVDAETRRLRREMAELDVESVEIPSAGEAPAGAKAGELAALGSLLVTLAPAVVPKVLEFLQSWALRGSGRTVKVRVTSGDRSVDVELSAGSGSDRELKELLATVSSVLGPPSGAS